eukprot:Nitzschia sp. Nitz4//scaffold185_size43419//16401//16805//NITZ4_007300-RA/size43419-processed-gene-0.74-mRNA-1//1//CDS//3329539706//6303//frame0
MSYSFINSGSMLFGTGVIHSLLALAIPEIREPTLQVVRDRSTFAPNINDRYAKEFAFWFDFAGIMMMTQGYLLINYLRETGRSEAPLWYGQVNLVISAVSLYVMPESGFWFLLFQSIYVLWKNLKKNSSPKKTT